MKAFDVVLKAPTSLNREQMTWLLDQIDIPEDILEPMLKNGHGNLRSFDEEAAALTFVRQLEQMGVRAQMIDRKAQRLLAAKAKAARYKRQQRSINIGVAAVIVLIGLTLFLQRLSTGPISVAAGVSIAVAPQLEHIQADKIAFGRAQLHPVASYRIVARIVGKRKYDSSLGGIAPFDLALGWQDMSESNFLKGVKVKQANRRIDIGGSNAELVVSAQGQVANTSIIPASEELRERIAQLRVGEFVELRGYLVNITDRAGRYYATSTNHEDSGPHASEIMFVESLQRLSPEGIMRGNYYQ